MLDDVLARRRAATLGRMAGIGELFATEGRVTRSRYLAAGIGLALVKYAVDAGSYLAITGRVWEPATYLDPTFAVRFHEAERLPPVYLACLLLWALPFLWIGVTMSARRARDAGLSPWLGLLFLVPLVHYAMIAVLVCVPTRESPKRAARPDLFTPRMTLLGVAACTVLTAVLIGVLTEGLYYYGTALFVGTPFVLGCVIAYLYNLPAERTVAATVGMVTLALLVGLLSLVVFALEGLVCLALAYPIMWGAAMPGAIFGRALARMSVTPDPSLGLVLLALPLGARLDQSLAEPDVREVVTSIEVDAPPEVVWENVVAFSELPPPEHWLFETGIAYPLRARIDGEGVGAVRRCEFTTGAFVEPITVWDEPRRLSFDVVEQPQPMEEWSFYAHLDPPHLERSFQSVRGEFRLTPTKSGGTLLEGSTWYVVDMGPSGYWQLWSDPILHRIHRRVLEHVCALSEAAAAR